MSRFDHVQYDEKAKKDQAILKCIFEDLEGMIEVTLINGDLKACAMKALEESFMWCGQGIREQQTLRAREGF